MSAIRPGTDGNPALDPLLKQGTRVAALGSYVVALLVAVVLVRPAFEETPTPSVPPSSSSAPLTDALRKGETVATFAARHGLALGDLLALNPKLDTLSLEQGTELRIG